MSSQPQMFAVRITFDAPEGREVVRLLVDALNEQSAHLASVAGVAYEDGYVAMEFESVSDNPGRGPTSLEAATPGAEIVAALEGFSHQHSPVVPVMRALLTMSAAREASGLAPRQRMRIDIAPAPVSSQASLSTHLSETVHPANPFDRAQR